MSHMSGCCAPHRRTLRHPNHLASRTLDTAHSVTVSQQLPGHPTDRKLDGSSGVALDVSGCFWIISMLFNAALSIAEPWLLSNSGHFQEELAQAWHKHGTSMAQAWHIKQDSVDSTRTSPWLPHLPCPPVESSERPSPNEAWQLRDHQVHCHRKCQPRSHTLDICMTSARLDSKEKPTKQT